MRSQGEVMVFKSLQGWLCLYDGGSASSAPVLIQRLTGYRPLVVALLFHADYSILVPCKKERSKFNFLRAD